MTAAAGSYDVIVVGSGGAGLRAALAAAEDGARVAVVTKGSTRYSGATASANFSYCAQFGYFGPSDTAALYAADIGRSGQGLAEPALARRFAAEAGLEADAMEGLGLKWRRQADGRHALATFGGHAFPRAIHVGLRTGKALMAVLARAAERAGIDIVEYGFAVEILQAAGRVAGLLVFDIAGGRWLTLRAPAVVLATGGSVAMFDLHTNPDELTGDGHALAYDAGAAFADVEFIQHYPTVFLSPAAARGLHYPTGRLLGLGGRLLNAAGEEFFHHYHPEPIHLATRDAVARAIALEVGSGRGTPAGGVFVDARGVSAEQLRDIHFESYFHDIGVHVDLAPQEVTAAAHYSLGGIRIDAAGRTDIPGLFAAGEVAGGLHGANRLTGTALPEILVFGAAAGHAAASAARGARPPEPPDPPRLAGWLRDLTGPGPADGGRIGTATTALRQAMQIHAGVLKTEADLAAALAVLDRIEDDDLPRFRLGRPPRRFDWALVQALELRCMLIAARLHCLAALHRTESRGAHQRLDWPDADDRRWLARLVLRRGEDGPSIDRVPLTTERAA